MKIDIDKLSESELIDLNRRIIARVRFLQQIRTHKSMLRFSVGDKVCFEPEGEPPVLGVIKRYNKKTVSVLAERSLFARSKTCLSLATSMTL